MEGFYPIIWKDKKYNMIYSNIGHNDIDYEHKYEKESVRTLSQTFKSKDYSNFILNALYLLAKEKRKDSVKNNSRNSEYYFKS
jgi:uncharacterized protein